MKFENLKALIKPLHIWLKYFEKKPYTTSFNRKKNIKSAPG